MGYLMREADKVAVGFTLAAAAALIISLLLAVSSLMQVDAAMLYKAGFILLLGLAVHFWLEISGGE